VQPSKTDVLRWEKRWATPAAVAALLAFALVIAAIIVATQAVGNGGGESELLRRIDSHRTAQLATNILQAIAVALLAPPLYYLFRATRARSQKVRAQLVGLVVAAPLILGVAGVLNGLMTLEASHTFVTSHVPTLITRGAALDSNRANEVANNVISSASLRSVAGISGLIGAFGFLIAMAYTSLHAMRSGLLTRFWGSLGIALGAISLLPFPPFYFLWFIYLGLLLLGKLPGGRPPAWAAGQAIPWPTPGEKAAAGLNPPTAGEEAEPAALTNGAPSGAEGGREQRRKRKQRE